MHAELGPVAPAQVVSQGLGDHFHARLRDIVGRVARRRGDPLFRAGDDDRAGCARLGHGGREGLDTVDHAPEVGVEDAPPRRLVREEAAARFDAGIEHDDGGWPARRLAQGLHVLAPADIGGARHNLSARRRNLRTRRLQRLAGQVGEDDPHARGGETAWRRRGRCRSRPPSRRPCRHSGSRDDESWPDLLDVSDWPGGRARRPDLSGPADGNGWELGNHPARMIRTSLLTRVACVVALRRVPVDPACRPVAARADAVPHRSSSRTGSIPSGGPTRHRQACCQGRVQPEKPMRPRNPHKHRGTRPRNPPRWLRERSRLRRRRRNPGNSLPSWWRGSLTIRCRRLPPRPSSIRSAWRSATRPSSMPAAGARCPPI